MADQLGFTGARDSLSVPDTTRAGQPPMGTRFIHQRREPPECVDIFAVTSLVPTLRRGNEEIPCFGEALPLNKRDELPLR